MHDPETLHIGARVRMLQPDYIAGKVGIVLGQEELEDGSITDRWLIQAEDEDIILSLPPTEFEIME